MTTTMHISLPESLKEYVRQRVAEEHYSNPSDYVRALIREDQKRRDEERLERMLIEGLESGSGVPMTDGEWKALRKKVQARVAKRAANG
jgi:antitoxin ParD1/3/4